MAPDNDPGPPDTDTSSPIERSEIEIPWQPTGLPALLDSPAQPWSLLVLAHGAGAGMRHPHLERLVVQLAGRGIAVLRYEFEYMAKGSRRPDRPARLHQVVAAAVETASEIASEITSGLPVFGGGRSMGGRMTSQASAEGLLPDLRGIVFFAFPLHPPKRPGTERADHLSSVECPMLFLQGTRDPLTDLELLGPVVDDLGDAAALYVVDGADHSFAMLKRSGRTQEEVEVEIAEVVASWMKHLLGVRTNPLGR